MLQRRVWSTYCGLYEEFGHEPVSVPRVMGRVDISLPSCRKIIGVLKRSGLLTPLPKAGREALFEVVPPSQAGAVLALSRPLARQRYVLDFVDAIGEAGTWYVVGSTALNYYHPYHAPVFEVATRHPREAGHVARGFPLLNASVSGHVPKRSTSIPAAGVTFRVASFEDAVIRTFSSPQPAAGAMSEPALCRFVSAIMEDDRHTLSQGFLGRLPRRVQKRVGEVMDAAQIYRARPPSGKSEDGTMLHLLKETRQDLAQMIRRVAEDAVGVHRHLPGRAGPAAQPRPQVRAGPR